MIITSPAFEDNATIPEKYTCDGGDINPELHIHNVPEDAVSLALVVDDPDAPGGTFTHWTVWNIDPKTTRIKEESVPSNGVEGMTSFGRVGYGGPCPPPGKPHRYYFKLYALKDMLNLPNGTTIKEFEAEKERHLIEKAELIGLYGR
ncbi:YbhB/YbcL family Raf kinase inhibitor-like protein [Candidatus Parcubacteria bacterium]|nr:MAG: YbhB/YbcL family Raf kinase inhibitor-like protein [Candidatus Parcubacteria bacterium]